MKSAALALILLLAGKTAWAQTPDPRDSIIIESKSVARNLTGSLAFGVRILITNKDSLSYMTTAIAMRTIAGTAYALLNRSATGPLTFGSVVNNLTNTLRYFTAANFVAYNDVSPDSFRLAAGFDGTDPATIEPPNVVRKPVWELKFGHSSDSLGQVLFYPSILAGRVSGFVDTRPVDLNVNFLPGVLTVEPQKGDLNLGGDDVTGADIVWEIRCIFGGDTPPAGRGACDLNCDGEITATDIVVMLTYNFVTLIWPC